MKSQAQTHVGDYRCHATWSGSGEMPVAPDETYLFIDTTASIPPPRGGDIYNPVAKTWTRPSNTPRVPLR